MKRILMLMNLFAVFCRTNYRLFIRLSLFLCIFLLNSYRPLNAHTDQDNICYAPIKNIKGSGHVSYEPVQDYQSFITNSSLSGLEKEISINDLTENEIEEDEWISLKRYLKSSNYLADIFYALLLAYFFLHIKKGLRFSRYSSFFSSFRSLTIGFCVFRI
ncbi:hypothetical protein [Xanthovirga aplysinae]|uniref:hypothetical protein n=1 Tax=Xanthovirga aplysinae TaxID=2529853 RepID=UPI0012BCA138|nr:hypothetical protein [Xanthovirga aplysinae]MTI33094.1 hypothetical protein [Xanthovirga aplysinae]